MPDEALFRLVCPGCGAAGRLSCLLHGDVIAAVRHNTSGVLSLWFFVRMVPMEPFATPGV